MARYTSSSTEEPGQYPAPAFTQFGLPVQNEASGAPGTAPPSTNEDSGGSVQPGQYPDRDDFTGVVYDLGGASGSGAPGTAGVGVGGPSGPDSVTYTKPSLFKSEHYNDTYGPKAPGMPLGEGYSMETTNAAVSGPDDWTQANAGSYGGKNSLFLPALANNMPQAGQGPFQPGDGHVLVGGYRKGQRPDRNGD